MKLKTIVIVNDSTRLNGGTSKVAFTEAKGLVKMGFEVIFFGVSGPPDDALKETGARIYCLEEPDILEDGNRARAMLRGIWNTQVAEYLKSILSPLDPNTTAIHAHSFSRALSPSIGPILTRSNFRSLFTMHEYFLSCPNGGFYDYKKEHICERKPLGLGCLLTNCDARSGLHKGWRLIRQAVLWNLSGMPRDMKDIAFISKTQMNIMRPYLPDDTRFHHILNPAELSVDAPRVHAEVNDVFLFVGRLMPEKGALDFAESAKRAGVKAVFLGAGPQKDMIKSVYPGAEILGWVSPDEVKKWIDRARVLVFPSVWPEPFGLVAAEALSRGVPVVAGSWNAASEMIENGVNGIVYSSREELQACLERLRDTPLQPMSESAYSRRFSYAATPEAHCERVAEVLESLR